LALFEFLTKFAVEFCRWIWHSSCCCKVNLWTYFHFLCNFVEIELTWNFLH